MRNVSINGGPVRHVAEVQITSAATEVGPPGRGEGRFVSVTRVEGTRGASTLRPGSVVDDAASGAVDYTVAPSAAASNERKELRISFS